MNNNDINRYKKLINSKNNNEDNILHKYLKNFFTRCLLTIIIFLSLAIAIKTNKEYKNIIYKNIYQTNLSFSTFKKLYKEHLGGISFIDNIIDDTKPVFNNKLEYKSASKYYDGVSLEVDNNYLVPVINSGIIVYIGKKEKYGNCIIIQGIDGIDITYSDISNSASKLYDYVEEGELLGEIKGNKLNLIYSKNGKVLNYEDYLK